MSTLIDQAKYFAIKAHGDQKRKYTGEPYWHHLEDVAVLVSVMAEAKDREHCQIVAWLHDVIEDTPITYQQVKTDFGEEIAEDVLSLTDTQTNEDGNRAFRKNKAKEILGAANSRVQSVKLADLISNTSSIVEYDPKFAKVYLTEKEDLLQVLTKGDQFLFETAKNTLAVSKAKLEQTF